MTAFLRSERNLSPPLPYAAEPLTAIERAEYASVIRPAHVGTAVRSRWSLTTRQNDEVTLMECVD